MTPADAYPPFDALVAAYSEPHRHYHTEHSRRCSASRVGLPQSMAIPSRFNSRSGFMTRCMIRRPRTTRPASAEFAAEVLTPLGVPGPTIEKVKRLVLATAHLLAAETHTDRDTVVLLDADLAILAASEERYRRYAADIRKEYGYVPDADYRAGRGAVLKLFLARPRLFQTAVMFEEGEARARANLAAELAELQGS
ncbi:MAG: hypothetical protein U0792_08360 [Gemmataceae bacterium]